MLFKGGREVKFVVTLENSGTTAHKAQKEERKMIVERKNQIAATAVITENGYIIGLAEEGKRGWIPAPVRRHYKFATYEDAQKEADEINKEIFGLSKEGALQVVLSSL